MDYEAKMDAAIKAHEAMSRTEKRLVGVYQEQRLAADMSGGEDGMWFIESVDTVLSMDLPKVA